MVCIAVYAIFVQGILSAANRPVYTPLTCNRPIAPPEPDAGTEDNPIEYITGLACEAGKYYIYNVVLYRCTRDYPGNTGHNPAQLVGHYFKVA